MQRKLGWGLLWGILMGIPCALGGIPGLTLGEGGEVVSSYLDDGNYGFILPTGASADLYGFRLLTTDRVLYTPDYSGESYGTNGGVVTNDIHQFRKVIWQDPTNMNPPITGYMLALKGNHPSSRGATIVHMLDAPVSGLILQKIYVQADSTGTLGPLNESAFTYRLANFTYQSSAFFPTKGWSDIYLQKGLQDPYYSIPTTAATDPATLTSWDFYGDLDFTYGFSQSNAGLPRTSSLLANEESLTSFSGNNGAQAMQHVLHLYTEEGYDASHIYQSAPQWRLKTHPGIEVWDQDLTAAPLTFAFEKFFSPLTPNADPTSVNYSVYGRQFTPSCPQAGMPVGDTLNITAPVDSVPYEGPQALRVETFYDGYAQPQIAGTGWIHRITEARKRLGLTLETTTSKVRPGDLLHFRLASPNHEHAIPVLTDIGLLSNWDGLCDDAKLALITSMFTVEHGTIEALLPALGDDELDPIRKVLGFVVKVGQVATEDILKVIMTKVGNEDNGSITLQGLTFESTCPTHWKMLALPSAAYSIAIESQAAGVLDKLNLPADQKKALTSNPELMNFFNGLGLSDAQLGQAIENALPKSNPGNQGNFASAFQSATLGNVLNILNLGGGSSQTSSDTTQFRINPTQALSAATRQSSWAYGHCRKMQQRFQSANDPQEPLDKLCGLASPIHHKTDMGSVWLQPTLNIMNLGTVSAQDPGGHATGYGAIVGGDYHLNSKVKVGALFGYNRYSYNAYQSDTKGHVQVFQPGIYGAVDLPKDFRMTGVATLNILRYHNDRAINLIKEQRVAKSSYTGTGASCQFQLEKGLPFGKHLVTPYGSMGYNYLNQQGFTENGAGLLNTTQGKISYQNFLFEGGLQYLYAAKGNGFQWAPYGKLGARYMVGLGNSKGIQTTFVGNASAFETNASFRNLWQGIVAGGFLLGHSRSPITAYVGYEGGYGSKIQTHQGLIRLKWVLKAK